ncbi:hypothetical protein [Gordonia rubripertincta]|uniref:LapA family protein n=1 Tax=Gordonia rubripertincta TaxID=36822 RepID=A0ABT4MV37_GORRU|nr:hypothetical protein [Gordonia rubripertincta]MCZ4550879.1 hypothetical protein [Gordonia rubripertincta]
MTQSSRRKTNVFAKVSPAGWAAVALSIIAVIFVLQNRRSTNIQLFWITVDSPLWFTLLVVFAVGWLVGVLTMRGRAKRTS